MLALFVFVNNTSLFARRTGTRPIVLAHRGIAQQFDRIGVDNDTCTASRMLPPTHGYLENTLASMEASFAAGADIVEFDVHPTTDGSFAVFHDWTLDCRTDGHGVTRNNAMADLKKLDIGYGYTADGGETFPFRGKGVGLMPSLDEVLDAFPGRAFLINVKSNDASEGEKLAQALGRRAPEARRMLMVYGGDNPIAAFRRLQPDVKTTSRESLKSCLVSYEAYGWTGYVPRACANLVVFVPINVAPWIWGWPERFLERMSAVGSATFVLGPYQGGGFSTGIDSHEQARALPEGYTGGVMTNEVQSIAPVLRGNVIESR